MSWTPATFVAAYPEFAPTLAADTTNGTSVIVGALASGVSKVDSRLFGADTDEAVAVWAGHVLSTSPMGLAARLDAKGNALPDLYLQRWSELARMRAGGGWSAGQTPSGFIATRSPWGGWI